MIDMLFRHTAHTTTHTCVFMCVSLVVATIFGLVIYYARNTHVYICTMSSFVRAPPNTDHRAYAHAHLLVSVLG